MKDKKISIGQNQITVDEYGYETEEFKIIDDCNNIWAYYRHLSAKEIYASNTNVLKSNVLFMINYNKELLKTFKKNKDLILKYNENNYNIEYIDDFEGYMSDLKLYCYIIK